jgi:sporadic carbohydrate cluster protein (TIGR04323 family)
MDWYIGYIFSRKINNNFIPQKVQNLVIRDYALRHNYNLKLSATEYKMQNSYLMLDSLNKKNANYKGIIVYSIFMLLEYNKINFFLNKLLNNKIFIISALEEIKITTNKEIINLQNIFYIKKNSKINWK